MDILINQIIDRDYHNQKELLIAIIQNPCQTRQYIVQNCEISPDQFSQSYPILKQYGIVNELEVPVIKNQRLSERYITVYKAFPEQILASVVKTQIVPFLTQDHSEIMQMLFINGRTSLQEIEKKFVENKTQRQIAIQQSGIVENISQLTMKQLIQTENIYNSQQYNEILKQYFEANSYQYLIQQQNSQKNRKQKSSINENTIQQFNKEIPNNLQNILKNQTLYNENSNCQQMCVNYINIQKYTQLRHSLNNIKHQFDEITFVVASFLAINSNCYLNNNNDTLYQFTATDLLQTIQQDYKNNIQTGSKFIFLIIQQNSNIMLNNSLNNLTINTVNNALQQLTQSNILVQQFDHYAFNYQQFIINFKINIIARLVNERYQKEAGRILKALITRKYLDTQQLEYECIISKQTCQSLLNQLQRDGFVKMLTIGKQEWSEKSNIAYMVDENVTIISGLEMACRVASGFLDCQENLGGGAVATDMRARASQLSFALIRALELLVVLI